ncbi:pentatricopeptide repeat-containing protein At5g09450, mitochondrial isoform X2 [Humulus lupulus]|uniref:pentatricopeptide repeat-containing protein At5g09450, mitochondrial isoform X2 n=1 Tax=Humulus lupulus TaxID=3486 RepID=UPI002B40D4AC|nr:pentatricopeptide repeat-containing protein At5g09450, mitochondrial isoform X2 [Humulus lupulus]XP_062077053.1 pentatricopeptide repeat-containing protein At5g09450, mitochondrial isoform X2 [Humulus lupulus]XP_062077054.1 pentatricopeptide repeat-containing protein At5g09450, mitochondrial isoform X2 [Humulus lupulus]
MADFAGNYLRELPVLISSLIMWRKMTLRVESLGSGNPSEALLTFFKSGLTKATKLISQNFARYLRISGSFSVTSMPSSLQISEWMVTHDEFEVSVSDYAIRINLMTKVFGIDAAERYFEGLPLTAKTSETYTALLHSYAGAKLTEKAENLYERMKDSDLSLTALTYNEMMTMYISVGLVEKVSLVVEELKRQKVTPDIFTYNLWISSSAATMNVDEVRRILDEMSSDPGCDESWQRYINLANIYITTGHFTHGESNSLVSAEKGITQREWITYDFLIILHAGLGNRDRIDQIWKSLRMTNQKMTRRNYICILSSYLMLGNLKEVGEVIDQWRQSTSTAFDVAACGRLLNAFTDIGLTEKAKDFQLLLIEKKSDPADIQSSTTN